MLMLAVSQNSPRVVRSSSKEVYLYNNIEIGVTYGSHDESLGDHHTRPDIADPKDSSGRSPTITVPTKRAVWPS